MEFTASFDTTAKITTACVCLLFLAICVWNAFALRHAKGDKMALFTRIALFAILFFTLGYTWLHSTKGYTIENKILIIKMHLGNIPLTYLQITDVRKMDASEMKSLTRSFGFGGLFGYNGHYHNAADGNMTFYATRQSNWVLIHTVNNKAIVLTPDDPDNLVYQIKALITPNN